MTVRVAKPKEPKVTMTIRLSEPVLAKFEGLRAKMNLTQAGMIEHLIGVARKR